MFKYFLIIISLLTYSCSSSENRIYDGYQNPYQYQNQYYQAPVVPYQQQYYPPNSRAYNNPYVLPQQYASPYYDTDQYYVPPTNYYNIERPQSGGASNKY